MLAVQEKDGGADKLKALFDAEQQQRRLAPRLLPHLPAYERQIRSSLDEESLRQALDASTTRVVAAGTFPEQLARVGGRNSVTHNRVNENMPGVPWDFAGEAVPVAYERVKNCNTNALARLWCKARKDDEIM